MQKIIKTGSSETSGIADAINIQTYYDIAFLTQRLISYPLADIATRQGFAVRTIGDVSDMILSAGCTASLCAFGLKNGEWTYPSAKPASKRGIQIVEALENLKETFRQVQDQIDSMRVKTPHKPVSKALALLGLAIDAVDEDLIEKYMEYAELEPSEMSTMRKAGLACEEFFQVEEDNQPAPAKKKGAATSGKIRFTGNVDNATRIVGVKS